MREFILRARKAPVKPEKFLDAVGTGAHVEYLAHNIINALFVSKGHRQDTILTIVLEDSADFSRALTFDGRTLGSLTGLHEKALLGVCASALRASIGLGKAGSIISEHGIAVRTISFEHLVKEKADGRRIFILDRKGQDVQSVEMPDDPVFILTDHIPMPKKTFNSLARLGVEKLSLGTLMLHASQCITLLHGKLDR